MALLWRLETHNGWVTTPLAERAAVSAARGVLQVRPVGDDPTPATEATIARQGHGATEHWVLLAPPRTGVWVNGSRVPLGIRELHDRDEIRIDAAEPVYFSTERLARIETYTGSARPAPCPRCKQAIETGSPAVCCPQCQAWFHQSEELGCWLYGETCCICGQATALDVGYRWSPEEL
jgi:hypothetical protein